jgi:hypothetical protein
MTGQLQTHGDGGGFFHCVVCGGDAAGPCAKCRNPVCGDCCVLVDGTLGQWAICTRCEKRFGRNQSSGWRTLAPWLLAPIVLLVALLVVLHVVFR